MGTSLVWAAVAVYLVVVLTPRAYWVLRGRRCPQCAAGRLSFQGVLGNPWRRLRSWWRCDVCQTVANEVDWGRLELAQDEAPLPCMPRS